jgi:hypothetical protein
MISEARTQGLRAAGDAAADTQCCRRHRWYASTVMQVIKATVRNGRIVVDEPTSLPEGHEVELCVVNDDGMSDEERRRLRESIARGIRDGRAGREMDFDEFMDQLDGEP